jgi:CDGSH-type Zn-finger protein
VGPIADVVPVPAERSPSGDHIEIVAHAEGPYLVRGPFVLVAEDGTTLTDRRVVALCGCGRSRSAPLCDGSHKTGRFSRWPGAGSSTRQPGVQPAEI